MIKPIQIAWYLWYMFRRKPLRFLLKTHRLCLPFPQPPKLMPRSRGQSWTPPGNGEERHRSELRPNPFGT